MRYFLLPLLVLALSGCEKFPIAEANNRPVGDSAHELLSNDFPSLDIEVLYMPGYALNGSTLSNLQSFLQAYLYKSGGITVSQQQIPSDSLAVYDLDKVKELESIYRTMFTTDDRVAVHVLVVDGNYSENGVLGVAYRNTSICLFGNIIHENSGGLAQPSRVKLETTVLTHEFGHLLGLVDLGSPMVNGHKDSAHGNHCSNTSCLMYYAVETTDFLGFLVSGNIPVLDADCEADLQANGGL